MATINLGAIKFNWKGAYNSGTSYAVDDVVSSGGNSYVCIQAHSNQAVGDATAYWNIMSSAGTNGTDGTDVGTTLTTQGDILYRDGSGLQRLPKGTANQVLKMNSGATAPEYGTLSSDFVKIASNSLSAGSSSGFNFEGFVNNSTYSSYYLKARNLVTGANNTTIRFLTGTNTEYNGNYYRYVVDGRYHPVSGSANYDGTSEHNSSRFRFSAGYHASSTDNNQGSMLDFWFTADAGRTAEFNAIYSTAYYNNGSDLASFTSGGSIASSETWTGIKFYADGGTINNVKLELYGLK